MKWNEFANRLSTTAFLKSSVHFWIHATLERERREQITVAFVKLALELDPKKQAKPRFYRQLKTKALIS